MYKYGDYSAYINSLKNKKTCNGNYTDKCNCCPNHINPNPTPIIPSCCPTNNGYDIFFTDKTFNCNTIMITYEKRVTYIEAPLDICNNQINRTYILQSNRSIPNGTFKTIVNDINISNNTLSSVTLVTEYPGGFAIFDKYYTTYTFVYGGEDLELLWNDALGAWTVIKYSGLFQ